MKNLRSFLTAFAFILAIGATFAFKANDKVSVSGGWGPNPDGGACLFRNLVSTEPQTGTNPCGEGTQTTCLIQFDAGTVQGRMTNDCVSGEFIKKGPF